MAGESAFTWFTCRVSEAWRLPCTWLNRTRELSKASDKRPAGPPLRPGLLKCASGPGKYNTTNSRSG